MQQKQLKDLSLSYLVIDFWIREWTVIGCARNNNAPRINIDFFVPDVIIDLIEHFLQRDKYPKSTWHKFTKCKKHSSQAIKNETKFSVWIEEFLYLNTGSVSNQFQLLDIKKDITRRVTCFKIVPKQTNSNTSRIKNTASINMTENDKELGFESDDSNTQLQLGLNHLDSCLHQLHVDMSKLVHDRHSKCATNFKVVNGSNIWKHELILLIKQQSRNPCKFKFGYSLEKIDLGYNNNNNIHANMQDINLNKLKKKYFDSIKVYDGTNGIANYNSLKNCGFINYKYFLDRIEVKYDFKNEQTRKFVGLDNDIMSCTNEWDVYECSDCEFVIHWKPKMIQTKYTFLMFAYVTLETSQLTIIQYYA